MKFILKFTKYKINSFYNESQYNFTFLGKYNNTTSEYNKKKVRLNF